jgi:hypothetical protein
MSHFGYNPKDANQAIPAGTYDASIKAVIEDKEGQPLMSKKGEPMQKIVFEVYAERTRQVTQYFTAKSMLWMYKKMAVAIGQKDAFDAGTFNAKDHIGANLRLELSIEESVQYGEQNVIDAFLPPTDGVARTMAAAGTKIDEDDIPF